MSLLFVSRKRGFFQCRCSLRKRGFADVTVVCFKEE